MELRSISEEERVKSGLTRAKLGGLSKAEIMEMVKIIIFVVPLIIKRDKLGSVVFTIPSNKRWRQQSTIKSRGRLRTEVR